MEKNHLFWFKNQFTENEFIQYIHQGQNIQMQLHIRFFYLCSLSIYPYFQTIDVHQSIGNLHLSYAQDVQTYNEETQIQNIIHIHQLCSQYYSLTLFYHPQLVNLTILNQNQIQEVLHTNNNQHVQRCNCFIEVQSDVASISFRDFFIPFFFLCLDSQYERRKTLAFPFGQTQKLMKLDDQKDQYAKQYQPSQSNSHLINNIFIIRSSLIRHAPTTIYELKLTIFYQFFEPLFLYYISISPPAIQKRHFDDNKLIIWVLGKLINYCVIYILNSSPLYILSISIVVFINCFKPSNIIMTMRDQMNSDVLQALSWMSVMFSEHLILMKTSEKMFFLSNRIRKCCKEYKQQDPLSYFERLHKVANQIQQQNLLQISIIKIYVMNFQELLLFDNTVWFIFILMFPQNQPLQSQAYNVEDWYKYQQQQIQSKFDQINTDAIEEIRNKLRKRQTKNQNQQNMELIQQQRIKIINKMKQHVAECQFPSCSRVQQITLCYKLLEMGKGGINDLPKDNVVLIVKYGTCTGFTQTTCPVGSIFNTKMIQTHKILKGI